MIKINGQSFDSAADGSNTLKCDSIEVKEIRGLESIVGSYSAPQGETGLQGTVGETGPQGETGLQGPAGTDGVVDGVLTLAETTTPTPVESNGKIYTKDDNCLYFQDGAGVEHKIAFDITE